jgi:hypothetical protein
MWRTARGCTARASSRSVFGVWSHGRQRQRAYLTYQAEAAGIGIGITVLLVDEA